MTTVKKRIVGRTFLGLTAALVAALLSAPAIFAANWTGGTGDFLEPGNWDSGTVPGATDFADIGNGGTAQWNSADPHTVLELRAGWAGAGTAELSGGGTFTNLGWLWAGGMTGAGNVGTITLSGAGTVLENVGGGRTVIGGASGDSTGVMNVNSGATFNHASSEHFMIGAQAGSAGTLNISGGTVNKTGGLELIVGDFGSGTVNHTGGTLNVSAHELWIGASGATGTYNFHGGQINHSSDWFILGIWGGATGILNMTDGTLTRTGGGHMVLGSWQGSHGTVNQSGGLIDLQSGDFEVGVFENSTGTANISGTAELNTNAGIIHMAIFGGSQGTLNLDGGVVKTRRIQSGGGTSTLTFNGGVLQATGDEANFISANNANIGDGGFWLDNGGFNIGVNQNFSASGNGAVTLLGGGNVTLNGNSSFGGQMLVAAGTTTLGAGSVSSFVFDEDAFGMSAFSGDIEGALVYGGDLHFLFDSAAEEGTHAIFLFGSQSGDFANVTVGGLYDATLTSQDGVWTGSDAGLDFTFSQLTGELNIIPEPSTYALLGGLGALALVVLRRRKN